MPVPLILDALPQPPPHCALMQKYPESSYADCIAGVAPANANATHLSKGVYKYGRKSWFGVKLESLFIYNITFLQ